MKLCLSIDELPYHGTSHRLSSTISLLELIKIKLLMVDSDDYQFVLARLSIGNMNEAPIWDNMKFQKIWMFEEFIFKGRSHLLSVSCLLWLRKGLGEFFKAQQCIGL